MFQCKISAWQSFRLGSEPRDYGPALEQHARITSHETQTDPWMFEPTSSLGKLEEPTLKVTAGGNFLVKGTHKDIILSEITFDSDPQSNVADEPRESKLINCSRV